MRDQVVIMRYDAIGWLGTNANWNDLMGRCCQHVKRAVNHHSSMFNMELDRSVPFTIPTRTSLRIQQVVSLRRRLLALLVVQAWRGTQQPRPGETNCLDLPNKKQNYASKGRKKRKPTKANERLYTPSGNQWKIKTADSRQQTVDG